MFFAYLDESDTKKKTQKWLVLATVMIKDHAFDSLELLSSIVADDLIPEEKADKFEEFHACELYGGYGIFEGIEDQKRQDAIRNLLKVIADVGCIVIYGAVDLTALKRSKYGSALPMDIAFRMCLDQMQEFLAKRLHTSAYAAQFDFGEKALLIADDCDGKIKGTLQQTFRSLRIRVKPVQFGGAYLCLYDDIYFGDSRYSIGIQIADLCAYFIARHLDGDQETEPFYEMIAPQIVSGKKDE